MNLKSLTLEERKELKFLNLRKIHTREQHDRLQELRGKIIASSATKGTTRRAGLKKVSKKMEKVNREYTKLRKQFLLENSHCALCGAPATDIHHRRLRGKYMLDVTTFMAVCRFDHDRIHGNPAWAREQGYLLAPNEHSDAQQKNSNGQ